jgi:hypothetical protein
MSPPAYVNPPNSPSLPTTMTSASPTNMTPITMAMPDRDGGSSSVYGSPPGGSSNIATSTLFPTYVIILI